MTLVAPRVVNARLPIFGRLARRAAEGRFALPLAVFGLALLWTSLARLPYNGFDFAVDAFYDVGAHLWTRGVPPLVGVYDVKPPGFFALLAGAQLALGPGPGAVRAVSIMFDALAATALFFAGRRLGSTAAGALAAVHYPMLSEFLPQEAAYSSLDAFVIFAALAALAPLAPVKRALLAGLAMSAALSLKQTAILEAAAILTGLLVSTEAAGRRWRVAAAFAIGAASAPLGILLYYAAHGAAGVLIDDVVVFALQRPGVEGLGFNFGLVLTIRRLAPLAPLVLLACWPMASRQEPADAAMRDRYRLVRLWLIAALIGLILQRALFNCYLGPMLAPCLLLAGIRASAASFPARWAPAGRVLALGVAALAFLPLRMDESFVKRHDDRAIAGAAAAIRATRPAPDDRLFVVDYGRWLYSATDLAPPTPFILPMHFLCEFPNAGPRRLAEALALEPRYIVVGTYLKIRSECKGVDAWPMVDRALAQSYRLLAEVKGDFETYEIYEATRPRDAGVSDQPG
jgi:hypothetical protein